MSEDAKAMESLMNEMQLTRMEMAALTDALNRLSLSMKESAAATINLAELIVTAQQRGFWKRLGG